MKTLLQQIKKYYWIVGIPLFIWGFILTEEGDNDIDNNLKTNFGQVYTSYSVKNQPTKKTYKYKYSFKGKKFSGSEIEHITKGVKIGAFYKIEYSIKNPENSRMLFDREYLQRINIDSLTGLIDTIYLDKNHKIRKQLNKKFDSLEFKFE